MDDEELWLPHEGSVTDDDGFGLPVRDEEFPMSSADGIASASNSLALASPNAEDLPDPLPMRRLIGHGVEVPDFLRIPEEHWPAVMRSIPLHLRLPSVQNGIAAAAGGDLIGLAMRDFPPTASDRARAAVREKPSMAPPASPDHFRRAQRQVNFRLTDEEHLDLAAAAELIGTTPTQLAGQLVRNGVRRILQEIDADGSRPAS
jgi:hypothetical protein